MKLKKAIAVLLAEAEKEQKWLAGELGVSEGALSQRLKNNTISTDFITKAADIFGVKPSELIRRGEQHGSKETQEAKVGKCVSAEIYMGGR